ncbi:MAG: hypothetical protein IPP72_07915 [Chitinophagaceae bacterium]|nr:hypothetical protein [Chitinophagaceae bacterium]
MKCCQNKKTPVIRWLLLLLLQGAMAMVQAQPNINKIEYYVDADPGYGNAVNLSFTGTQPNVSSTINLDLTPLDAGVHIIGIRSRDANGAWSLDNKWIFLKPYPNSGAAVQPNINRVEWFLDTDPGYGNATPITIAAAQDLPNLAINIDLVPLNAGVHIVGIRSRDANGAWSLDNKWIFLKPHPNTGATPQPNINRVEWFLDTDPGYGNATPITISTAQDLPNLAINIDLTSLNQGVHIVGIRSRDANGAWSLDNKWLFLKPYPNTGAVPQPNINRVEWFLDTDPGYGNATPISIVAGQDLQNLAVNIDLAALNQGVHIVGIRSRDANGAWSIDNKWIFLKPYTGISATPQPKVTRVEYFIDTDPGYGRGTPVTITSATDIASLIFDADISTVPNGAHKLGIRSLDENGAWSLDNEVDFTGGTLNSNAYQWVGNVSAAWNTAANWSSGIVPTAANNVVIPANRPFNPTVANGIIANCKSITVSPGASVTVATGGSLKVNQ